jgi:VIT1/CCC1 family predicted Fe2+/Mn2+ transporter
VAHKATAKNTFLILAGATALAVLIPILTFLAIPALLGRVIVTILVTLSVTAVLLQSRLLSSKLLLSQEGGMCVGLYGSVMLVIAGIMA